MRALSSEGVISVGATLILASERSGPPGGRQDAEGNQRALRRSARQDSAAGIAGKVRLIAKVVGAEAEGEELVQKVMDDFKLLADRRAKIKPARCARCSCWPCRTAA